MQSSTMRHVLVCLGVIGCFAWKPNASQAENPASAPLVRLTYTDPPIELPTRIKYLADSVLPVWRQSLEHSEFDLKRQVASAVAVAHSEGFRDMSEFIAPLRKSLAIPNLPAAVRIDIARALVVLNAIASQDELVKWLGTSNAYDAVVYAAIARWRSPQFAKEWLEQATDTKARLPERMAAAEYLKLLGRLDDVQPLVTIVDAPTENAQLRIAVAKSVNRISPDKARILAETLIARADVTSQLLAAALLEEDDSAQALLLNEKLAASASPLVVAAVWPRLLDRNPAALMSFAEQRLADRDPKVRHLAVQVLAKSPTEARIEMLTTRLGDRHPLVRVTVRDLLIGFARADKFDNSIRSLSDALLKKDDWRAQEQAIYILGSLDHESAAQQFVSLLDHQDAEVAIAAAWGLRAVANKETYASMLQYANSIEQSVQRKQASGVDAQKLAFIFETFGQEDYRAAEPLMRTYVPKSGLRLAFYESRAAAVWALGKFHAMTKNDTLSGEFIKRLNDIGPIDPEADEVRYACAVAVGRIGSDKFLKDLKVFAGGGRVGFGCAWAIHMITGEPCEKQPIVRVGRDWLLSPL